MENKITDNEIIKAIQRGIDYAEFCGNKRLSLPVEELKAILVFMKSQQAEIERLEKALNESDKKYNLCAKRFFKEGVNGLADRLKRHWRLRAGIIPWYEIHEIIGDLVKEMAGE